MQTLYKIGEGFTGLFAEHGELSYDAQVFEADDVVDAIAAGWYETPWEAHAADKAAEVEAAEAPKRTRRTKAEIEAAQQAETQSEAAENGENV